MALVVKLLGRIEVTYADKPLRFAADHARALLAYLAVESDVAHPRTTLVTLLWPEENEATARHNLRQALFFLKRGLAVVLQRDAILQVTATTIRWNSQGVSVDFISLQALWRLTQSHTHADVWACAPCVERQDAALALYQGEFLQRLLLILDNFEHLLAASNEGGRCYKLPRGCSFSSPCVSACSCAANSFFQCHC